jgi:N4-(beta-N-acetylglucosaminyl)-L-asparaginase
MNHQILKLYNMKRIISRRNFINKTVGISAGALVIPGLTGYSDFQDKGTRPLIITSHTNETGQKALEAGWEILAKGGSAVDAVEKAANIIEVDPEDTSVGYGGLPNERGIVQLDASFMDGKTYSAGAVACLENIKTPVSVAKLVMQHTDHVLLAGAGALGTPEHLQNLQKKESYWQDFPDIEHHYGTTNVLAIDINGDIAGCTTTSGLSFKINGRVGDSPIIGAGLYVDNEVGAAGATGRGEDVIKSCASYYIVLKMKEGRTPQQACEDALRMIVDRYRNVNPDYYPSEKFVAINKSGETGCTTMKGSRNPQMSVMTSEGYSKYEGIIAFPGK